MCSLGEGYRYHRQGSKVGDKESQHPGRQQLRSLWTSPAWNPSPAHPYAVSLWRKNLPRVLWKALAPANSSKVHCWEQHERPLSSWLPHWLRSLCVPCSLCWGQGGLPSGFGEGEGLFICPATRSAKHRAEVGSSGPWSLTPTLVPAEISDQPLPARPARICSKLACLALSTDSFLPASSASQAGQSDTPEPGFFLSSLSPEPSYLPKENREVTR